MTLLKLWFSYRGTLRGFDFIVKGFAPGIALGVVAMIADERCNARGGIFYPFLAFSLWPASAMLTKVLGAVAAKRTV